MLQNAYFLAKIGADTAENEQHFAEILPKTGNYPTGPQRRVDLVMSLVINLVLSGAFVTWTKPWLFPRLREEAAPRRGADREASRDGRVIFARFRLYRRRSLQVNTRFAVFFKIYQISN